MTLRVTLNIYSGMPDPTWEISGKEEEEFRRLLEQAPDTLRAQRPILGYRGFTVVDPDAPQQVLARRGNIGQSFTGAPEIEEFLWRSGGNQAPPFPGHENFTIAVQPELRPLARAVTCPPSMAADAPAWNPSEWAPPVQGQNNCYNYAVNHKSYFAWPGNASFNNSGFMTPPSMYRGATSDGLIYQPNFDAAQVAGAGHYVALVIRPPGRDYHWYRQDDNGCWSHKIGAAPVRNDDQIGQPIADPRYAHRGAYTQFVCFFLVPPGTVVTS